MELAFRSIIQPPRLNRNFCSADPQLPASGDRPVAVSISTSTFIVISFP